ncbi:MAG: hypothetical protein ACI4DO_00610 [Roseburia sp.]
MLKRINQVLPELLLGIVVYGIFVQILGIWFVEDKFRYTTGLWIGIILAGGSAIHMAVVLRDSMDLAEKGARTRTTFGYMLRYAVILVVCFLTGYFKLGNVVTLFIGVLGLKAGAYLQPFTHKVISKMHREKEELPERMQKE